MCLYLKERKFSTHLRGQHLFIVLVTLSGGAVLPFKSSVFCLFVVFGSYPFIRF